jgi:hypothetical protein
MSIALQEPDYIERSPHMVDFRESSDTSKVLPTEKNIRNEKRKVMLSEMNKHNVLLKHPVITQDVPINESNDASVEIYVDREEAIAIYRIIEHLDMEDDDIVNDVIVTCKIAITKCPATIVMFADAFDVVSSTFKGSDMSFEEAMQFLSRCFNQGIHPQDAGIFLRNKLVNSHIALMSSSDGFVYMDAEL